MKLTEYEIKALEGENPWHKPSQEKKDYWNSLTAEEKETIKDRINRHLDFFESFKGNLDNLVKFILKDDLDNIFHSYVDDGVKEFIIGDYKFFCVDSYGGDGQGDDYWRVYKVEQESQEPRYFRFDGWYASYEGSCIEDVYEVKPKTKTITVYE